jgi:hypothetical protein
MEILKRLSLKNTSSQVALVTSALTGGAVTAGATDTLEGQIATLVMSVISIILWFKK